MDKRMIQNGGERRPLGGRLFGVDVDRQLANGSVALLEPRGIVLKVEHDAPSPITRKMKLDEIFGFYWCTNSK